MGVYVYTMRKKMVGLRTATGERVNANLFSFAFKDSCWPSRDMRLSMDNSYRHAGRAFADYTGGYVIVGDTREGIADLDGAEVYQCVTRGDWTDTGDFPGELVGFVQIENGRAYLRDTTRWASGYTTLASDGRHIAQERRCYVVDGKIHEEMREVA